MQCNERTWWFMRWGPAQTWTVIKYPPCSVDPHGPSPAGDCSLTSGHFIVRSAIMVLTTSDWGDRTFSATQTTDIFPRPIAAGKAPNCVFILKQQASENVVLFLGVHRPKTPQLRASPPRNRIAGFRFTMIFTLSGLETNAKLHGCWFFRAFRLDRSGWAWLSRWTPFICRGRFCASVRMEIWLVICKPTSLFVKCFVLWCR